MTFELKRGDIVIMTEKGSYSKKPRPALVIQAKQFSTLESVTLLPLTSDIERTLDFRIEIQPSHKNKLEKPSQIMVDKILTVKRSSIGRFLGHIEEDLLLKVDENLTEFLGLHRSFSWRFLQIFFKKLFQV
ncbi:MAG: type II toxin-antitoxin system PemK/MazF family toxin [Acetobacter sp.]|nr:type II toxin-antitoxin system PemK/MazF family toxin [Acetobacter sp.]